MGLLDGPFGDLAKTLTETLGATDGTVTYRRRVRAAYNLTTGGAAATTSDESITPVIGRFEAHEIKGTIKATDLKVLIARLDAGLTAAPVVGDALVIAGVVHEIVWVDPLISGDLAAMYEVAARR